MRLSPRSRWQTLGTFVVALALAVGLTVVLLARRPVRAADRPGEHAKDVTSAALVASARRDHTGELHAMQAARRLPAPAMVDAAPGTGGRPILVLPARDDPYDLFEVVGLVPGAFTHDARGRLVLVHPLFVAPGAALTVDASTVPTLLLASDAHGYATITGRYSTIRLRGSAASPLRIRSFDPQAGRADTDWHDGRAYLAMRGGHMALDHVAVSDLGFASTGATSGVAWLVWKGHVPTGEIRASRFARNYFGVYTAGVDGFTVTGSRFVHNTVYGFDPHTASNNIVMTHSVAAHNGRHGIIFSEGCNGNVVRDTASYANGGSGFVVDDGRPENGLHRPSNRNRLVRVSSHDNGGAGVVIEGGTGNVVKHASLRNEREAVRVSDEATGTRIVGTPLDRSGSSWSFPEFLHGSIAALWGAILLVPLAAGLATRRRRFRSCEAAS